MVYLHSKMQHPNDRKAVEQAFHSRMPNHFASIDENALYINNVTGFIRTPGSLRQLVGPALPTAIADDRRIHVGCSDLSCRQTVFDGGTCVPYTAFGEIDERCDFASYLARMNYPQLAYPNA